MSLCLGWTVVYAIYMIEYTVKSQQRNGRTFLSRLAISLI